jgi:CarD family transcriptional regulator
MKSETLMAQKKTNALGSKASKGSASKSVRTKVAATKPAKAAEVKVKAKTATAKRKPEPKAPARKPVAVKTQAKPQAKAQASKVASKPLKPSPAKAAPKVAAHKPAAQKPAAVVKPAAVKPVAQANPAARAMPAAMDKGHGTKISAPVPAAAAPKPAVAAKPAAPVAAKPATPRHGFKVNEYVVYPTQGVGKVIGIEEEEIAGMKLELFKIEFEKERLVLRVPMGKVQAVGMRKLADDVTVKKSLETLKGRARVKRTMWSRRAQEYVAKINSGDLISIAEVVRDLYRSEAQPEQSYSERQLYEDALERMAREIAAVERLDERGAVQRITEILSKSAKGRSAAADGAGSDGDAKAA